MNESIFKEESLRDSEFGRSKTSLFKVGKNAVDNWKLFKEASQKDWWFHLNSDSSPFVIVKIDKLSKEDIQQAASLVKDNSKRKGKGRVKVVYTQISNLKRGSEVGEVIIKSNKKCRYMVI